MAPTAPVAQAKKILKTSNTHQRNRAKQVFRKLGAVIYDTSDSNALHPTCGITFEGIPVPLTDEHMVYLKWLTNLNQVNLRDMNIIGRHLRRETHRRLQIGRVAKVRIEFPFRGGFALDLVLSKHQSVTPWLTRQASRGANP
jgi:hypothetical protein